MAQPLTQLSSWMFFLRELSRKTSDREYDWRADADLVVGLLSPQGYGGIMVWLIGGASEAAIILWLMFEIMRAPNGYQDESGFHEVKEGNVCSKIEDRAGAIPVKIHREVVARKKMPGLNSM